MKKSKVVNVDLSMEATTMPTTMSKMTPHELMNMVESSVEPSVKPSVEPSVEPHVELPESVYVGKPLGDIGEQCELMMGRKVGRYVLEYTTYGSVHNVSVFWDGERLSF